ncbi:hypothetical protein KP509_23G066700 [Ceratopteris richardii]|uniref:DUF4219 domain-containing protein n=1 Tax=Ceratopteris richardii TaxID=49495 RepID=A0A8T2S1D7_CERRI|nr:hypothetical protein KP509_23G066700 [Ceratopteris richardii]
MGDNIAQIVGDKLNKDNYHIWLYRMENFLMEKGLWGLVNGGDECPELPENLNAEEQKEYKTWIEKSRKALDWISICISESFVLHIMKASPLKEAWEIVHKNMQNLHSVWGGNRSITDYVAEIRKITDDLASINGKIEDDDMVLVMVNRREPMRGTMPDFDELVALCMREVKHGLNASGSGNSSDHAFFEHRESGSSRGVHLLEMQTQWICEEVEEDQTREAEEDHRHLGTVIIVASMAILRKIIIMSRIVKEEEKLTNLNVKGRATIKKQIHKEEKCMHDLEERLREGGERFQLLELCYR